MRLGSLISGRAAVAVAAALTIAAVVAACGGGVGLTPNAVSPSLRQHAGSDPPGGPPTPSPRPSDGRIQGLDSHVWVEGDSVLLGTVDTLPDALKGWTVHMDTVGSRRLTEAIPVLRDNRYSLGPVVAIQMGNNYIPGEDGDFASQLVTAMHIMRNVQRVVWVTVATASSSQREIDRDIMKAAKVYPSIRVANWAPIIAKHPGYAYDGLHLTPTGRLAMAKLIASKIGPAPGQSQQRFFHHLHKLSYHY